MSLALEHYRAIREGNQYPAAMPADEAARALNAMLTETQQLTLSQLPSSAARQLGSILFSHEAGLISAFGTLNPPKVKIHSSSGAFSLNLLFLILMEILMLIMKEMKMEKKEMKIKKMMIK